MAALRGNRMRASSPSWGLLAVAALCAVLLSQSVAAAETSSDKARSTTSRKSSRKSKVKVYRVETPASCQNSVRDDSVVGFYYSGRLEDGTVAVQDTSVVGRPDELDMSKPRDGLMRAVQRGVRGACNGERRRVLVPPAAHGDDRFPSNTVELLVHVVTIDGVAYEGEAPSTPRAEVDPASECGACRVFVRKFIKSWYVALANNMAKVANNDGKEPPSLTYNEDLEEVIQTLCSTDEFQLDTKVDTRAVVGFCERTMTVHKRRIAEQAMKHLNDVTKSWLPFTNQVCGLMAGACPVRPEETTSACDTCKALVQEAGFDLAAQGASLRAKPAEKRAWAVLLDLCGAAKYSHGNPASAGEVCEDLVEDHGKGLVGFLTSGGGLDPLTFCERAGMCGKAEL